jgi:hypothetical protein
MRGLFLVFAVAAAAAAYGGPARSGEKEREVVPEVNAFFKLSDRARIYVPVSVANKLNESSAEGEVGAFLDYTLVPVLRPELRDADWERARYLWVRAGYTFGGLREGLGVQALKDSTVRTLSLEATGRVPLEQEAWLVHRLRLDLRDVDGESSERYRYRLGVEREYRVRGTAVVPYAQAELVYDTRFGSWSRQIYQLGAEVEINARWRIEPYWGRQDDSRTSPARIDRLGLVLKYYH